MERWSDTGDTPDVHIPNEGRAGVAVDLEHDDLTDLAPEPYSLVLCWAQFLACDHLAVITDLVLLSQHVMHIWHISGAPSTVA